MAEGPNPASVTVDDRGAETGTPARTPAHLMRASRQILDEALHLRSYIDGRLRYEAQLFQIMVRGPML